MQIIARINVAELNFIRWMTAGDRIFLNRLMIQLTRLGDGWFWAGLFVGVFALDAPSRLSLLLAGAFANGMATTVFLLVKRLTGRQRPCELRSDLKSPIGMPDHYSFPSGHSINAFAFTVVLSHFVPEPLTQVLLVVAGGVAISRVYLRLHYPTDVLAGSILGYLIGTAALWLV